MLLSLQQLRVRVGGVTVPATLGAKSYRAQLREKMANSVTRAYANTIHSTNVNVAAQPNNNIPGIHGNANARVISDRGALNRVPFITLVTQGWTAAPPLVRRQLTVPMNKVATHWAVPSFSHAWLAIGMPTVPRPGNPDYLLRSIASFVEGLPRDDLDPFYRQVQLVVMNNQPGNHSAFYEVRGEVEAHGVQTARDHISFIDNPGTVLDPDPTLPEPNDRRNPNDYPGSHVRNQTAHVLELMKMLQPKATLYMFLEDDFIFCRNWLEATRWALKKASFANPGWGALRISFGMSGLVLRSHDLPHLMDFVWTNITLKPVDLLWADYLRTYLVPHARPLMVYRFILLEHIGSVSSFAARDSRPPWPGCYQPMSKVWSLHKDELYDISKCRNSDICPCKLVPPTRTDVSGFLQTVINFNSTEGTKAHP
eukprot:jgi/Mesvir1/7604/Mv06336-RA.1